MSVQVTSIKLGLLTIAAVVAGFAVVFALGLRRAPTDAYHTYFDESVQGLDLGAPVKYRGVSIGRVASVAVAPDRRHVDVELAVDRGDARRLDLEHEAPRLRARLAIQGVTGLKFVDVDLADPADSPPEALPFPSARRFIPSRRSLLDDLGGDLATLSNRLPLLVDRATTTLAKLERVLDDVAGQRLPARLAAVLDGADATLAQTRHLIAGVDSARLPGRLAATADRAAVVLAHVDGVLTQLEGAGDLLASVRRTSDTFGDVGRSTQGSTAELDRTLRDLGEAARALRDLVDEIDRDPDMLVKGRARTGAP